MVIILVLVLYWFITMGIQLGISAANIEEEEEEDRSMFTVYCVAIFAGWVFVPIFIGEALGLYLHKAIKERYS